jgi:hypothetical protein
LEFAVIEGAVPIRLLGISGGLRRHSYCTAIHPYNEDEEGERLPRAVLALADKISLRRLARPAIA